MIECIIAAAYGVLYFMMSGGASNMKQANKQYSHFVVTQGENLMVIVSALITEVSLQQLLCSVSLFMNRNQGSKLASFIVLII